MKKLILMKTIQKDGHHMFIYKDGKKTPIPDDGVVFVYLSEKRMLKATEFPDRAGAIDGKFVVTDEIKQIMGKPAVNNVPYDIWGVGENYVVVSAKGDKFYISGEGKTVVTHPNQGKNKEAYEKLYELYKMLI